MQINNFSSYFEIFAALNLAYAGFESFAVYTLKMFRGRLIDESVFEDVKTTITAASLDDGEDDLYKRKVAELQEKYKSYEESVKKSDREFENLSQLFAPSFLINGLFCLVVIVLGGFEQSWTNSDDVFTTHFLSILNITVIYIIGVHLPKSFVFFGFSDDYTHWRFVTPFIIILLISTTAFFISSYPFPYDHVSYSKSLIFIITLLTGCSSFLISLPRVIIRLRKFNTETKPLVRDTQEKLNAIKALTQKEVESDLG